MMFTKRQTRNILVIFSTIFTFSILFILSNIYISNFPNLISYNSNAGFKESVTERSHVVKLGENLADISKKYYGSPKYIDTIYEANENLIPNKLILEPGISLIIPFTP